MRIVGETRPVGECGEDDRRACFELLRTLFLGIRAEDFVRDFEEKDAVMLLRDAATGCIGGFSTLVRLELDVDGDAVPIVFSGDTAVLPEFRTSLGLGHELSRWFAETPALYPGRTPYWVLISKGWRTYRLPAFFFREFFPRADATLPREERRVRDAFGTSRYPLQYDVATGVIRAEDDAPRVRPDGLDASPPRSAAFFAAANPGYLRGDQLVCVARIEPDNFAPALLRFAAEPAFAR
jgi:hypothetical protein